MLSRKGNQTYHDYHSYQTAQTDNTYKPTMALLSVSL